MYLLDTDTCACILLRSSPALLKRTQAVTMQQQAVSAIRVKPHNTMLKFAPN